MGFYRSFFGPSFYSPSYVWYVSSPGGYYSRNSGGGFGGSHNANSGYNPAYGYNTVQTRSAPAYVGNSTPAASAPAPAASGGAARVGDSGAGRGGSGGRAGH